MTQLGAAPQFTVIDEAVDVLGPTQDWIFTFGSGHRAHSALYGARFEPKEAGQGFRLDDRYVVIHGTHAEARQRMVAVFGQVWCAQYGTRESAGVDEYKLTELVITDG